MSAIQIYKPYNGRYKFNIEAFKKIFRNCADNLVAIYSITGPLRMGKSFMLNFFLKYLKSNGKDDWIASELENTFTYRGGAERETTGIWIWSEPFIIKKSDGTKISLILMDTQGIFDPKTSNKENAIVFALCTLLSSFNIFNIQRQIDENILQALQYFTGFARFPNTDSDFDEPFQRLMFLIRDWEFDDDFPHGFYDNTHSIDGKNYKNISLAISEDQPQNVNYVHGSILKNYDNVGFYLMPPPGRELSSRSNFDMEKIEKDFLQHLGLFVSKVLDKESIVPKTIAGEKLTGSKLIRYVEQWAGMFENDAIPEVRNITDATGEIQNEMAKSAAIDNYRRRMKSQVNQTQGMSEDEFDHFNSLLFDESIKLFKSFKKLGGKELENKYIEDTIKNLEVFKEYSHQSNKNTREVNEIRSTVEEMSKRREDDRQKMNELKDEVQAEKFKSLMEKIRLLEKEKRITENPTHDDINSHLTALSTIVTTAFKAAEITSKILKNLE